EGSYTLDGDASIRRRPVDRIALPLQRMGAVITSTDGCAPITVEGGHPLAGINYELPVASAQVKSCLLLAGLLAEGETTIVEPLPARAHAERLLAGMGADLHREGNAISVTSAHPLEGVDVEVPGDFSSAAFVLVAALLVPDSDVVLEDVGLNGTRIGLLPILARMGVEMGARGEGESLAVAVEE